MLIPTTIKTASGKRRRLPAGLEPHRVVGLDPDNRLVVDDFDAFRAEPQVRGPYADGHTYVHQPFLFGLTLCCNASDKGVEDGVVCRACYSDAEIGSYLYRDADGSFPGFDPVVEYSVRDDAYDLRRILAAGMDTEWGIDVTTGLDVISLRLPVGNVDALLAARSILQAAAVEVVR